MGWLFCKKPAGVGAVDYIKSRCFPPEWLEVEGKQITMTAFRGGVVWFALKIAKPGPKMLAMYEPEPDGSITAALVYLYEVSGGEVGWKSMDETMGPYTEVKAYASFMAKLSKLKPGPATKWAAAWRARQEQPQPELAL